jgi:hypothetical protein
MSKQALYHYAENLHILQRAQFTDSTGKARSIGENGRDLLVWLCDATNQTRGYTFHHSYPYMAEHSGVHVATVKRLLAGFEQLGWITRTGEEIRYQGRGAPTVEYVLTFYPKAWTEYEKWRPSSQTSSHRATDNVGKANTGKALPEKIDTETEPQPQLEPKPQPGDLGNGGEFDELLRKCIEWELANYPGKAGTGLLRTWRNEYTPIVTRALQDRPTEDLVLWSVELRTPGRTGYQRKPNQPAPLTHLDRPSDFEYPPMDERGRGAPGCPTCGGKGWYLHRENGRLGKSDCTCTTDTTTERVSADLGTNTPVMECPAPADTRSELRGVLQDMTSKYRMPADPY